jgi:hypothetical protein
LSVAQVGLLIGNEEYDRDEKDDGKCLKYFEKLPNFPHSEQEYSEEVFGTKKEQNSFEDTLFILNSSIRFSFFDFFLHLCFFLTFFQGKCFSPIKTKQSPTFQSNSRTDKNSDKEDSA